MKKFTFLLLASLLLPMTLGAKISTTIAPYSETRDANYFATRANGLVPQAIQANVTTLNAVTPNRDGAYVWDFEDVNAGLSPFAAEDVDGDGFNWQYFNNTTATSGRMNAHGGDGLVASASYDNGGAGALTPNNWLISPQVTLGGVLKFWACGQDASWAAEKFGVYVCVGNEPAISSFVQIGSDYTATGSYVEIEVDLSAYAGQTGFFAIVHHNITDMFYLNIDDITLDAAGEVTPVPTIPTNVVVTPTATTGEVAWVAGENNGSWNLRWRPYVDPANIPHYWDLPLDGYSDQLDGWEIYDADGDGDGWGLYYSSSAQDDVCFASFSFSMETGAALTPDNWLLTPVIGLGGTLKFKAWNADDSYPDVLGVYLLPENAVSLDEVIQISDDIVAPAASSTAEAQQYEIDLSAYSGMGQIIFRHYNCTDQYFVKVDNIEIVPTNPQEEANWTLVEDAANPYTIEGLTPETEYEVQVKAFNEQGDKETEWTESTLFTTLAEEVPVEINELYLVGSFNGWNWQNEEGRVPFELEDGVFTVIVDLEDGDEFKLITPDENSSNGWKWFGGVDENNVGFFLINEDLLEQPIELVDGANFRVEKGGNFTITVTEARGLVEPLVMTVVNNNPTAITDINSDSKDNTWYNIQGMKLQGVPTVPGIYINGGRKVVVK